MKSRINIMALCLICMAFFMACNSGKTEKKQFELKGNLEGLTEGNVILQAFGDDFRMVDTASVKNGAFEFKGELPGVVSGYLMVENQRAFMMVYLDNTKMQFTGKLSEFDKAVITGCKAQEGFGKYNKLIAPIKDKEQAIFAQFYSGKVDAAKKAELEKDLEVLKAEKEKLSEQFIKENPLEHHSAVLISQQLAGASAKQIEKRINSLPEELKNNPEIVKLKAKLGDMLAVEKGIDEVMANVKDVKYKVDKTFKGEKLTDVSYLGAFTNGNLCALKADGSIQVFSPNGAEIKLFKPELKGAPKSIAVDDKDQIYVMSALMKEVVQKVRGKKMKRMIPEGVECTIFDKEGKKLKTYSLEGIETATGARVVDNHLVVADYKNAKLAIYNAETGKKTSTINKMRPCCGILDFSVNPKKEILVANLGAFRVQGFDFTGQSIVAFGKRGKDLNDFHGCCNPVSVASLSSGAIVTVEKDPTRIKVYSKEGASQIAGIEELVTGCSYIPMIVDNKDNLYLASAQKGVVKCVAI